MPDIGTWTLAQSIRGSNGDMPRETSREGLGIFGPSAWGAGAGRRGRAMVATGAVGAPWARESRFHGEYIMDGQDGHPRRAYAGRTISGSPRTMCP